MSEICLDSGASPSIDSSARLIIGQFQFCLHFAEGIHLFNVKVSMGTTSKKAEDRLRTSINRFFIIFKHPVSANRS